MAKILVTGSSGFIGRHLVPVLRSRGHAIIETGRTARPAARDFRRIPDIGPDTDWTGCLDAIDCVIHLAGLAHRSALDEEFLAVNDAGTRRLVEACRAASVRTIVFLSSIAARRAEMAPGEANAYGLSKLRAESHVTQAGRQGSLTAIILRPPLVYGHDAPGNWNRLQRLAAGGLPLPFGSVRNRRFHCFVGNLCSAIATAAESGLEGRGAGIYEIADLEPVSLAETLLWLREGMGRRVGLLPVPPALLRAALLALGQRKLVESLLDDMLLDPGPFMRAFGWMPPEKAEEAIRTSGRLFMQSLGNV